MLIRFLKRFWKLILGVVSAIGLLIWVSENYSKVYGFCTTFVHNIAHSMKIAPNILIVIFALFVLCLLTLTLSILCIFNIKIKRKIKLSSGIEVQNIINFAANVECFSKADLIKKYSYSNSAVNIYIKQLSSAGIIKEFVPLFFTQKSRILLIKYFRDGGLYTITEVGDIYAVEHHLA